MAIFLFVGVPILGRILSSVMGRKLGALATGGAVGALGWFLTASLLVAAGAGIVALFIVGVMGLGGSRGGGIGPVIWGGGGAVAVSAAADSGRRRRLQLGRRRQLRRRRRLGAVVMAHWLARLSSIASLDEDDARRLLGKDALARIEARVAASEKRHSGEIRVVVEAGLPFSYLRRNATPRDRAVKLFGKLGVWDTERNNGVLIYLLLAERAIEIVADRGLNRASAPTSGREIAASMTDAFRPATSRPACCARSTPSTRCSCATSRARRRRRRQRAARRAAAALTVARHDRRRLTRKTPCRPKPTGRRTAAARCRSDRPPQRTLPAFHASSSVS